MDGTGVSIPSFIPRTVEFPDDGTSYELLDPLTDYMSCHDGSPAESRVVFTCKRQDATKQEELVVKIKVQDPNQSSVQSLQDQAEAGPSTTTAAELAALKKLNGNPFTPDLVAFRRATLGADGPLPGGYITYTVMTKLQGSTLFDAGYREMLLDLGKAGKREEIGRSFLEALKNVYKAGIDPIDRGLRNILWDEKTGKCGIIDFELWEDISQEDAKKKLADEREELMRWGLVVRPPPKDWYEAWGRVFR